MAMIEMHKTGPLPITAKQLDEVEKATGLKFPESYRQFMLETNGGFPLHGTFHLKDGEDGSELELFYHLLPGDRYDLLEVQKGRQGRLPTGFLAIADDPYSNEICINCTPGLDYGAVYFWDHEMEAAIFEDLTPDAAENYHLIADSFPDLLTCLYERIVDPSNEPTGHPGKETPGNEGMLEYLMERLKKEGKMP